MGGHGPSPRTRTFSASSSSDVVAAAHAGAVGGAGLSFLRVHTDRQRERARSLSSVPTLDGPHAGPHQHANMSHELIHGLASGLAHHGHHHGMGVGVYDISESAESDSSSHEEHGVGLALDSLSLGRVYAAHSLPTNIWSLNGEWNPPEGCRERRTSPRLESPLRTM